jgi:hypothetical protein
VIDAYLYLQVVSIRNAIVQRLRRLRQPKYLFGALVGGAYLYFFLFRRFSGGGMPAATREIAAPLAMAPELVAIAALVLVIAAMFTWLIPSDRAALQFTEAEVTFLFPAPIARRTLIHFKLLRSQLSILVSALFMALVVRRGSFATGGPLLHAAGWWLILSTFNLHIIGASFTRERLLDLGINPTRRRALVIGLALAVVALCAWWLRGRVALPTTTDLEGPKAMLAYAGGVLGMAPISWLLMPFEWVVAPLFAIDAGTFFRAALPAALILVAHYFWVVHSEVSFEEASIDVARRRAERVAALRSGNLRLRNAPLKPRTVPFKLAPNGFPSIAFLWKSLIALGPWYRLRTWLIAAAVAVVGSQWLASDPVRLPLLKVFGGIALGFGAWLMILGPMFMRRGLSQTLSHLDILKAYPLRGWQIVLGELLSPMVVMTFLQWLLLLIAAEAFGRGSDNLLLTAGNVAVGVVGIAFVAPPLCGLMLCVPYAGMLYFPAWSEAAGSHGGGIEVMGQRLIFFGAYLIAMFLALIPAALLGTIAFLLGNWLAGLSIALALTALVVGAVLLAELAAAIAWLGDRMENFDLAQEMPR